MSEPSTIASAPSGEGRHYELSSELSRLCLPPGTKESHLRLAWVNSLCLLFLAVGLAGIKAPKVVTQPSPKRQEVVPVVFTLPAKQPRPGPEAKRNEPTEPTDAPAEMPHIVPAVAVFEPSTVALAMPVLEARPAVTAARLATPLPSATPGQSKPAKFDSNAADTGYYPSPDYPALAVRNHHEGTVIIELTVNASGAVTWAKVQKSSGFAALDEAALNVVRKRWRFPSGAARYYYWPCTFQLE